MFRSLFHHHPDAPVATSSPPPSPRAAETPVDVEHGRFALHIPLLSDAMRGVGDLEESVAARLRGGEAPAAPTAVLEVPATSGFRRFFANPISGLEATAGTLVRRLLEEAERSCTHFVCRWAGAASFAAVGLWAGWSHLHGDASPFNPEGGRHPAIGWPLVVLSAPLPVLPLVGAWVGDKAAHLACADLERVRP